MTRRARVLPVVAMAISLSTLVTLVATEPAGAAPARPAAPAPATPASATPAQTSPAPATGPAGADVAAPGLVPVTPVRLWSTGWRLLGERREATITVAGRGAVPTSGASHALVTVSVLRATKDSGLRLWASGGSRPALAQIPVERSVRTATQVLVPIGADGSIKVSNDRGLVALAVDVNGWVPLSSDWVPAGGRLHQGRLRAGTPAVVTVSGRAGMPAGPGLALVAVTTSGAGRATTLTASGAGPAAAPSNVDARRSVTTLVLVAVGSDGSVRFALGQGVTDLTVDAVGWLAPDAGVTLVEPVRVLEPGPERGRRTAPARRTLHILDVTGVGGVPSEGVTGVLLRLNSANSRGGSAVVTPDGNGSDARSMLVETRASATAMVVVPVGADGNVRLSTNRRQLAVSADLVGWIGAPDDDPPPPPPGVGAEWKFEDEHVLFTAPGQAREINLGFLTPGGDDLGVDVPAGLVVRTVGDQDAVIVEDLGSGRLRVTSTNAIGTVVIGVQVPGQLLAAMVQIMNVRLLPGVDVITGDSMVFPPERGDGTVDWRTAGYDDLDTTGAGPFTWDEITARLYLPEANLAEGGIDAIIDSDARIPLVLRGSAPAVGTPVIDESGARISGVVVEPAALPSLERDGFALVTIRLAAPQELFDQIRYTIDPSELVALGVVPKEYRYEYTCAEGVPAEDCASPDDTEIVPIMGIDPTLTVPAAAGPPGPSRVPHRAPNEAPQQFVDGFDPMKVCKGTLSSYVTELKLASFTFSFSPYFKGDILPDPNGGIFFVEFIYGYDASASAVASGKFQPTFEAKLDCNFGKAKLFETAAPGFLGAAITLIGEEMLNLEITAKAKAGPRLDLIFKCEYTERFRNGFQYVVPTGLLRPIHENPYSAKCRPTATLDLGTSEAGVPMSIELSMIGGPKLGLSVRIGGEISWGLSVLLNKSDLGVQSMLDVRIALRVRLGIENEANLLDSLSPSALALTDFLIDAKLKLPTLNWLLTKLTNGTDQRLTATLLEISVPLASLYRPPKPDRLKVTVDGEERHPEGSSKLVKVRPGEAVFIEATAQFAPVPVNPTGLEIEDAAITGGSFWRKNPGTGSGWSRISGFTMTPGGGQGGLSPELRAAGTMTPALCEQLKEPTQVALVADTFMFGVVPNPGLAAVFTLECPEPRLEFDRDDLAFAASEVGTWADLTLEQERLGGRQWTMDTLPAWLEASSTEGEFVDDQHWPIQFRAKCSQVDPRREVETVVTVRSTEPGTDEPITDTLPVKADCREKFIEFDPPALSGSGTVRLRSFGHTIALWELENVPGWATVTPDDGFLFVGLEAHDLAITVQPRAATCKFQPAVTKNVKVITKPAPGDPNSEERGSDTLALTRPAVPIKPDCNTKQAGGSGDPHMYTFDGGYYDAQVVGEYVYSRPVGASADLPVIHARHEFTSGAPALFSPTSITGLAVALNGHRVEFYARPNFALVVDGAPTSLEPGVPVDVGDGVSVSLSDDTGSTRQFSISAGSVDVSVVHYPAWTIFDAYVRAASGTPVEGLLGTPDDTLANDFVTSTGTVFTLQQIWGHSPELYELTDSWRITDPADSLFSIAYDGFDDPNLPYNAADLAPFRDQVRELLSDLSGICGTGPESALVEGLAMELAIGRSLGDVAGYTCSYSVFGSLTTDGPDPQGVAGATIELDAPGLVPCSVTTRSDGTYDCRLGVSLSELAALGSVTPPLLVTATAKLPTGTVVDEGIAVFPGLAPLGSQAVQPLDLTMDADLVPLVVLSGRAIGNDGTPLATIPLNVIGRNQAGQATAYRYVSVTPDAATGTYLTELTLPYGTVRADVVASVGLSPADYPSGSFSGLQPGPNALTFDVDDRAPFLVLTGRLIDETGAPLGTQKVRVSSRNSATQLLASPLVSLTPDPVDGTYSVRVRLPKTAVVAELVYQVGVFHDWEYRTVTGLSRGTDATQEFSFQYEPRRLHLTGTARTREGTPLGPRITLTVYVQSPHPFLVSGGYFQSFSRPVDQTTGAYDLDVVLPVATQQAWVVAGVSQYGADDVLSPRWADLTAGDNARVFDIAFTSPRAHISGTYRWLERFPDSTDFTVKSLAADGSWLGEYPLSASVDPGDGSYSGTVPIVSTAASVTVTARLESPSQTHFVESPPVVVTGLDTFVDFSVDLTSAGLLLNVLGLAGTSVSEFTLDVEAFDSSDTSLGRQSHPIAVDPECYDCLQFVDVLHSPEAERLVLSGALVSFDPPVLDVSGEGHQRFDVLVSEGGAGRTLIFRGTLVPGGVPFSGGVAMTVHQYDFEAAEWANDPPYALLATTEYENLPVEDGLFSIGFPVAAGADLATVVIFPNGPGDSWHYSMMLSGDQYTVFETGPIDPDAPQISFAGVSRFEDAPFIAGSECPAGPILHELRLVSLDSDTDPAGETPLGTVLIVPDPVTGEYRYRFNLAATSERIRVDRGLPAGYPYPPAGQGTGFTLDVDPAMFGGFGLDLVHYC